MSRSVSGCLHWRAVEKYKLVKLRRGHVFENVRHRGCRVEPRVNASIFCANGQEWRKIVLKTSSRL